MMEVEQLKEWFEEKFLKHSCFHSFDDLMSDKTPIQTNAPRALIAVELKGVWRGIVALNDKLAGE